MGNPRRRSSPFPASKVHSLAPQRLFWPLSAVEGPSTGPSAPLSAPFRLRRSIRWTLSALFGPFPLSKVHSLDPQRLFRRFLCIFVHTEYMCSMMESDRIILREWRESDADALFRWASDPLVGPRAGWPPHQTREESQKIIRTLFHNDTTWAIIWKENGEAIGAIGYGPSCDCNLPARSDEPTVGYWIAKPYWNRGICTEALKLMIEDIRQNTNINSLISGHFVDNPASGRVMEKCGFVPTGENIIDPTQYQGTNRPIRVLRLEL